MGRMRPTPILACVLSVFVATASSQVPAEPAPPSDTPDTVAQGAARIAGDADSIASTDSGTSIAVDSTLAGIVEDSAQAVGSAPAPQDSSLLATGAASDSSKPGAALDSLPVAKPTPLVPTVRIAPPPTLVAPVLSPPSGTRSRTIAIGLDTAGAGRSGRSTWAAVGLTLLLPGSGHRYLGHPRLAGVWMGMDLVTWSVLYGAWRTGALHLEDAAEIANRHAAARISSDPDPAFLEVVRDWRSRRPVSGRRDSYDEALLQQGLAPDSRFPEDAEHDWDWGTAEDPENNRHIAQFEDALKGWRTSRIVLNYAAGALLLSRAVAIADILRIQRASAARAGLQAHVIPLPDGGRAVVALRF